MENKDNLQIRHSKLFSSIDISAKRNECLCHGIIDILNVSYFSREKKSEHIGPNKI